MLLGHIPRMSKFPDGNYSLRKRKHTIQKKYMSFLVHQSCSAYNRLTSSKIVWPPGWIRLLLYHNLTPSISLIHIYPKGIKQGSRFLYFSDHRHIQGSELVLVKSRLFRSLHFCRRCEAIENVCIGQYCICSLSSKQENELYVKLSLLQDDWSRRRGGGGVSTLPV